MNRRLARSIFGQDVSELKAGQVVAVTPDDLGYPIKYLKDFAPAGDYFGQALINLGRSAQQFEAWEAVYGPVGADGYPDGMEQATGGSVKLDGTSIEVPFSEIFA